MPGQLETVLRGMFDALGRKDPETILGHFAEDTQGVDEISREWMRGREAMEAYVRGLVTQVDDVRSELRDVHGVGLGRRRSRHLLARAGLHAPGRAAPRLRTDLGGDAA